MTVQAFKVTLRHDRGRVTLNIWASDSDQAVTLALLREGAPDSAFCTVYQVDTTPPVSAAYGAPMGRPSSGPMSNAHRPDYRASRVRLNAGGYDKGGAYWGRGMALWAVQDGEGNLCFVRAASRADAINTAGGF